MADVVEDIKSRLDINTVVSQYVQLKQAGRNFKGLCPFHSEKTPSFVVSPEKQICHCFGCHKGGDIFSFIQEVEGVTFPEAVQILADKAGIKVKSLSKFNKKEGKSEKDEFFKAHDLVCEIFEKQLHTTNDGKKVLGYLKKRGIKDETIKEFRIGFAPDEYDFLYPQLLKKGISKKVLIKSGFVTQKSIADDRIYDKLRSRLMFPIFDFMGRICGFGGRALKQDQMPKYLNSPENIVYNKSKVLYGFSHSKQAIKKEDKVIVVEGYFDVILPYQEGVKNVVATSGTALTEDQVRLIKRLVTNVVTCFDTDEAGFEATKRSYGLFQKQDINVKSVADLGEKDPADLVKEKNGKAFSELIDKAPDFMIFFIDNLLQRYDVRNLDDRKKILKDMIPLLKKIPATEKDAYVREFAKKMELSESSLYDDIENFNLPANHPVHQSGEAELIENKGIEPLEIIISILLEYPKLFEKIEKDLDEKDFSESLKAIYRELFDQYNSSRTNFDIWNFEKSNLLKNKEKINVLRLYAENKYSDFSEDILSVELEKLIDRIKEDRKKGELEGVRKEIEETEKSGDKDKLLKLLQKQQDLFKN
jgi:DNA primase